MLQYLFALATPLCDPRQASLCLRMLPAPLRARVEATGDSQLRRQRLAAYNLLRTVWRQAFGGHMPTLRVRDGEPPCFTATTQYSCSVSHSGEWVFAAITDEGQIGVDVQEIAPFTGEALRARIAGRFYSAGEQSALTALPPCERPRAAAAYWAQKEAFVKMTGEGISALSQVDTTALPASPGSLLLLTPFIEEAAVGPTGSAAGVTPAPAVAALCFRPVTR